MKKSKKLENPLFIPLSTNELKVVIGGTSPAKTANLTEYSDSTIIQVTPFKD